MNTRQGKTTAAGTKIGRNFQDNDVVWEALNLPGSTVTQAGNRYFAEGNKAIAIPGDRSIETVLSMEWYMSGDSRRK